MSPRLTGTLAETAVFSKGHVTSQQAIVSKMAGWDAGGKVPKIPQLGKEDCGRSPSPLTYHLEVNVSLAALTTLIDQVLLPPPGHLPPSVTKEEFLSALAGVQQQFFLRKINHRSWKSDIAWCEARHFEPCKHAFGHIMAFLQSGIDLRLALSAIKVQILTLTVFFIYFYIFQRPILLLLPSFLRYMPCTGGYTYFSID